MYDLVDQKKMVYITFAVILLISALFAPIGIFYPLKAMFITPQALAIGTSSVSIFTGGFGLALLAAGLIVLATVEKRILKYGSAFPAFLVGLISLCFSLTDYYYITSEEFIYNAPFALTSEAYGWTDFEKVEERTVNEGGMTKVDSLSFYLDNGKVIEMSAGSILTMSSTIISNVERSGGIYERIEEE